MFDNKVSARSALRGLINTLGTAVALSLLEDSITEHAKINAYGRGRRTLEQQPWIHCREAVRAARKESTTRQERSDAQDTKVSAGDRKTVSSLVKEFNPSEVCTMVTQLFKDLELAEHLEACNTAMERHADRRAKFMPSQTAQKLGLVTLVPERNEEAK